MIRVACAVLLMSVGGVAGALEFPFGKKNKAGTETEVIAGQPVAECQGRRKASIAVSRFDNKVRNADYYRAGVGDAMADQLTTALVTTGCFKVVDRQNLKGVMDEMGLQQSGLVDQSTASRIGKLVGADLIITAAVTEFKDNTGGSRGGAGGGAGTRAGGLLGAIGAATKRAHMAADIRLTDVQTSEIIGATAVKGTARDTRSGVIVGALVPGAAGLGALESWENTPRGAALRQVIEHAVQAVIGMIPDGYYRHQLGRFGGPPKAMGAGGGGGANEALRKAQQTLKDFGIYNGTVDGIDGPQTQAAIREFQSQMGLEPTGKLDLKTAKEIRSLTE